MTSFCLPKYRPTRRELAEVQALALPMDPLPYRRALVPLGPWLTRAARGHVTTIPATFSPAFPVAEVLDALDHPEKMSLAVRTAFDWLNDQICHNDLIQNSIMSRWEMCASSDLKRHVIGKTTWSHDARTWLTIDDPRVVDILYESDAITTRLCVRPWVAPRMVDGFPLEFRVFLDHNGIRGISNYYPQRPLPDTREMCTLSQRCLSDALMIAMHSNFHLGCTMDFLVDEHNAVHFLEGGPPHLPVGHVTAHPCCFAPGQISGTAYEKQPGALDA